MACMVSQIKGEDVRLKRYRETEKYRESVDFHKAKERRERERKREKKEQEMSQDENLGDAPKPPPIQLKRSNKERQSSKRVLTLNLHGKPRFHAFLYGNKIRIKCGAVRVMAMAMALCISN
ncbi:hypothetical protein CR513_41259, partial [Mucuna pruriens]